KQKLQHEQFYRCEQRVLEVALMPVLDLLFLFRTGDIFLSLLLLLRRRVLEVLQKAQGSSHPKITPIIWGKCTRTGSGISTSTNNSNASIALLRVPARAE